MTKRVIIGSLVALALIGVGIGIGASFDGEWGPRHESVVVSGGEGPGGADAGQTIVVSDRDHHGFFFPFGLLFLLPRCLPRRHAAPARRSRRRALGATSPTASPRRSA